MTITTTVSSAMSLAGYASETIELRLRSCAPLKTRPSTVAQLIVNSDMPTIETSSWSAEAQHY
jgi:hypothetical protein